MEKTKFFIDGGCSGNPGPMGSGVVIEVPDGDNITYSYGEGFGTNNVAEYKALLRALQIIKDGEYKSVTIHGDSKLVVEQFNKRWQCKDKDLQLLLQKCWQRDGWLMINGYDIELVYIKREYNLADEYAKKGVLLNNIIGGE